MARYRQANLPPAAFPGARSVPEETIRAAIADINSGTPWRDASRAHGVSVDTIKSRARLLGLDVLGPDRWRIDPPTIRLPASAADLGYLAGIVDGEGTVSKTRSKGSKQFTGGRVFIFNTNEDLIAWLAGMGGVISVRSRNNTLGTKTCYCWCVTGRSNVELLLRAIRPHMRIKGHLADEILALYEENPRAVREAS